MSSHLGRYFKARRQELGLSLGELARRLGYQNVSKGARRVDLLEQEGNVQEEFLVKVMKELSIEPKTVRELFERDRQEYLREWEKWVNVPVPMRLIERLIPGVFGTRFLPDHIHTLEEAEAYACEYAKKKQRIVCLEVSRKLSIWIHEDGEVYLRSEAEPDQPNVPFMSLKTSGKRVLLNFGGAEEEKESNPPASI